MTDHKTAETIAFWDPVSWACCLGTGLLSTLLLIALSLVIWFLGPLIAIGGWIGVQFFFVLSGFVIARSLVPLLRSQPDNAAAWRATLGFWVRRACSHRAGGIRRSASRCTSWRSRSRQGCGLRCWCSCGSVRSWRCC